MLPLEELLGDDAREATEEVPLAVDNDNLRWRVGGEGAAVSAREKAGENRTTWKVSRRQRAGGGDDAARVAPAARDCRA